MKIQISILIIILTIFDTKAQQIVIPDQYFEKALMKRGIDDKVDGFLDRKKAKAVDTLDLNMMMITDLTGIEAFTDLEVLNCTQNYIKKLDLSKNTKLKVLFCGNYLDYMYEGDQFYQELGNQLSELDLSNNPGLEYINVDYNILQKISLSNLKDLKELSCDNNHLTSLDLQNNKNLISLSVSSNKLSALNTDANNKLKKLYAADNELKEMNFQNNLDINTINVESNQLSEIDIKKNEQLKSEIELLFNINEVKRLKSQ